MTIRGRMPWLCAALLCAVPGMSATIGFNDRGANIEQETLEVPIRLDSTPEEAVAGFQFDVAYNPMALTFDGVRTGPTATAAEKSAHANVLKPGHLRVVVAGFNRNAIENGDAMVLVFAREPVQGGDVELRMTHAILSDPFGSPVGVEARPDTLHVEGSTAIAMGASRGATRGPSSGMELLVKYRALVFAAVVVAFTMLLARSKPKKRRLR